MPDARGVNLIPRDPQIAYLSLGSNIGPREETILAAVRLLSETSVDGYVRVSSLYETAPVDCGPMRDFINAAVEVKTLHSPRDLLKRVQAIEREMGRRSGHNEPRELDIDIIAVGDRVVQSAELTLPHPRYTSRVFVLIPLQEIAAWFHCPATGQHIDDLVAQVSTHDEIRRVSTRSIRMQEAT